MMYPIERYLGCLKDTVSNKARPEGSIAVAYIVNECLTFCSMYLQGGDWRVVQRALHRHLFDPTLLNSHDNNIFDDDVVIENDAYQQDQCGSVSLLNEFHEIDPLYRKDIVAEIIDVSSENFIHGNDDVVCEGTDDDDSCQSDKDNGDDIEAHTDSESYSD
uniref:DUF4218 domain-containing protein n=1 Tax=Ananas comosus var. bracteatus TaxID=296719 RepID=A0A6V7P1T9_ANACO|nr:unnamed protein product [Ananas comosus var. bracteatus]